MQVEGSWCSNCILGFWIWKSGFVYGCPPCPPVVGTWYLPHSCLPISQLRLLSCCRALAGKAGSIRLPTLSLLGCFFACLQLVVHLAVSILYCCCSGRQVATCHRISLACPPLFLSPTPRLPLSQLDHFSSRDEKERCIPDASYTIVS